MEIMGIMEIKGIIGIMGILHLWRLFDFFESFFPGRLARRGFFSPKIDFGILLSPYIHNYLQ